MAVFEFKGRDEAGREVTGQLEGASREAVAGVLLGRGVAPVSIDEYREQARFSQRWQQWRNGGKIEPVDLIMFSRQMYTVTKAGIPLVKGIRGLAASLQHLTFKDVLNDVADRLQQGVDLSVAMGHHPEVFNRLYVSLIHVGENSGKLDMVFLQLSEYMERDMETRKSIFSALRYPSFVLIALVAAVVILNIWVIPVFADMFKRFNAELPLVTKFLISTSNFFVNYWHYLLVASVLICVVVIRYVKTDEGGRRWGRYKLRMPIVGDLIERATLARYCRSLGLMLTAGVPLPQSLELCSRVIDNPYLSDKIQRIREGIERGESLFQTHLLSDMFTPLVMQMISVGEESGQVDTLLTEVSEFYEREVDYDIKSLSAKIEPIMIVMMAVVVGVLALGIFMPMWELYSVQTR